MSGLSQWGDPGGRNPAVFPSPQTRGSGPRPCPQGQATLLGRYNALPGDGQLWMVQVQGQRGITGGLQSDAIGGDFARVKWTLGNTNQQIEADLPAAGLAFPLLAESIEVEIVRGATVNPAAQILSYAVAFSASLGGASAAKLTRSVAVPLAALGTTLIVPQKAVRYWITSDFVAPFTTAFNVDWQDAIGNKVGSSGTTNDLPPQGVPLPQSAAAFIVTALGVQNPAVLIFEINP